MIHISLPAQSDIEYLPGMKESLKALGAVYDSGLYVLSADAEIPLDLVQYIWNK